MRPTSSIKLRAGRRNPLLCSRGGYITESYPCKSLKSHWLPVATRFPPCLPGRRQGRTHEIDLVLRRGTDSRGSVFVSHFSEIGAVFVCRIHFTLEAIPKLGLSALCVFRYCLPRSPALGRKAARSLRGSLDRRRRPQRLMSKPNLLSLPVS